MPDYRKAIDDAQFKPEMTTISTTGPNAEGAQQTWQNPRDQLTQSSAQELAQLMGAQLSQVNMSGPYSQDKPQWQIDFSPDKGDEFDAAMVYDRYQRAPEHFSQNMADELRIAHGPLPPGVEVGEGANRPTTPGLGGGVPVNPGAGGGAGPGGGGPPNVPGPTWPGAPPPNVKGPDWNNVPPVPPATGVDPIAVHPGTGVRTPGGYTPGGIPPTPATGFPAPINLNGQGPGLLPSAATPRDYTPRPYNDSPVDPLLLPQLMGGPLPPAVLPAGEAPGGLLTLEQLRKRAGGGLPSGFRPGGLLS